MRKLINFIYYRVQDYISAKKNILILSEISYFCILGMLYTLKCVRVTCRHTSPMTADFVLILQNNAVLILIGFSKDVLRRNNRVLRPPFRVLRTSDGLLIPTSENTNEKMIFATST